MKKKICMMFTGQGSQYYGAGYSLYQQNTYFRKQLEQLDAAAKEIAGYSVLEELYHPEKKNNSFHALQYTHPAIFMLEYALARTLIAMGIVPDCVIGSSLGEIGAAAVAECEEPKRLLSFLLLQTELFERTCPRGGMLTILDDYRKYAHYTIQKDGVCTISVNAPQHFVMSGTAESTARMAKMVKAQNQIAAPLAVDFGFHCSCIDNAKDGFLELADDLYSAESDIPIYSCAKGCAVQKYESEDLWDVVRNPIRMQETVKSISGLEDMVMIDVSPQGTMAVLYRLMSGKQQNVYSIYSQFHNEVPNLEKLQNALL